MEILSGGLFFHGRMVGHGEMVRSWKKINGPPLENYFLQDTAVLSI